MELEDTLSSLAISFCLMNIHSQSLSLLLVAVLLESARELLAMIGN